MKSVFKTLSFQTRLLHSSLPVSQLPAHPLYPKVDWFQVGAGKWAVVDPNDGHGILYLSQREYIVQIRVSVTQDQQVLVLARPGDKPEPSSDKSSKSSPPGRAFQRATRVFKTLFRRRRR